MLSELDVSQSGQTTAWTVRRHYTWGMDLSQTGQGAGGIGGLLAARDPNDPNDPNDAHGSFIYFYDANGNVGQLVDAAGNPQSSAVIAAKYEYDAYGNNLLNIANTSQSGTYAAENPIRFSSKYWDEESGFGYWARCYSARLGRWLSRDPAGELGGLNIYRYVDNDVPNRVDTHGLKTYVIGGTAFNENGSCYEHTDIETALELCLLDPEGCFYVRGVGSRDEYVGGGNKWALLTRPGGIIAGAGTAYRVASVAERICSDVCTDAASSKINLLGWSRGAIGVMLVAQKLDKEGCCCDWSCTEPWSGTNLLSTPRRVCCDKRFPKIDFMGLFDPVDMRPGDNGTIPGNVRNCSIAVALDRGVVFPMPAIWVDQPGSTKTWRRGFNTDHGGVGLGRDAEVWMRSCACQAGLEHAREEPTQYVTAGVEG